MAAVSGSPQPRTATLGYTTDAVRKQFTGYERDIEADLDFAEARYYDFRHGRFTSVDPLLESGRPNNPQTWNRYIYVGNNPLNITDPTGLDWYYNKEQNRYKWFDEGAEIEAGYTRVVGSSGQAGSFVYESTNGKWITLNPYANNWQEFDTQADATKRFSGLYNCNSCQELANSIAENVERKGTTVAIVAAVGVVAGVTGGVGLAATGSMVGGTTTAAAVTTTATTSTSIQTASVIGRAVIGFTKHGINSAISHSGVGVSSRAILNTLKNPIKVIVQSEGRLKVVGKDAVVVINQAGKIITTWAKNSASTRVRP